MLRLKENRDKLISRAIRSMRALTLEEASETIDAFEYEPSEIIKSLFENNSVASIDSVNLFKNRKLKEAKKGKGNRKQIEESSFFSNNKSYLKRKEMDVPDTPNEIKG